MNPTWTDIRETACPVCGRTIDVDGWIAHARGHWTGRRRRKMRSLPSPRGRDFLICPLCEAEVTRREYVQHRCRSMSIRTVSGGGGPGTGKRR